MAARSGLWRDEAALLWIANLPSVADTITFLWRHESHPPVLYGLLRLWSTAFGESDAAALALPLTFGVALVPLTYWIGARLLSPGTGVTAAVFVAVSPTLVRYSAEVRPYSLLPLLALAATGTLAVALARGGRRWWALYVALTLTLLLTHNWSWLVLGGHWLIGGFWIATHPTPRAAARGWLEAQAALLLAFAPWLPVLVHQMRHAGHVPDAAPSAWLAVRALLEGVIGAPPQAPPLAVAAVTLVLVAATAWLLVQEVKNPTSEPEETRLALLLFTGVPVVTVVIAAVLAGKTNLLLPRLFVTVAPGVMLALAQGLTLLAARGRTHVARAASAALVLLFLVQVASRLDAIKSNAREVAGELRARAWPSDLIVVTPEWLAPSLNRYFVGVNPQINFPEDGPQHATAFDDAPARLGDPAAIARVRTRLAQSRREGRRVWLVMDRDEVVDAPDVAILPIGQWQTGTTARIRSNQLRRSLIALYGPPALTLEPRGEHEGEEILALMLFSSAP